jgi:hypothetical protein
MTFESGIDLEQGNDPAAVFPAKWLPSSKKLVKSIDITHSFLFIEIILYFVQRVNEYVRAIPLADGALKQPQQQPFCGHSTILFSGPTM